MDIKILTFGSLSNTYLKVKVKNYHTLAAAAILFVGQSFKFIEICFYILSYACFLPFCRPSTLPKYHRVRRHCYIIFIYFIRKRKKRNCLSKFEISSSLMAHGAATIDSGNTLYWASDRTLLTEEENEKPKNIWEHWNTVTNGTASISKRNKIIYRQ